LIFFRILGCNEKRKGNIMNWELELIGMKRMVAPIPNGKDAQINNFRNDDHFDDTICKVLDGTHDMLRYKKNQRKINYLKEQGKIL
jgi:hypothetical protein